MPNNNVSVSDNVAALILQAHLSHLIKTGRVEDGDLIGMMYYTNRCGVKLMQVERWLQTKPVVVRYDGPYKMTYEIVVSPETTEAYVVETTRDYVEGAHKNVYPKTLKELLDAHLSN